MVIAICDDVMIIRYDFKKFCQQYATEHKVDFQILEFDSGEEVINYNGHIDLLLLDINLPGASGIEVKNKLIENDNVEYIIFISGLTDRVWEAFSKKTLGFLSKPVRYEALCKKLLECQQAIDNCIIVDLDAENGTDKVKADHIIYVKAQSVYSEIITLKRRYLMRDSLSEWESRLGKKSFFRIHKSYLINMEYINTIEGCHTILDNGEMIKIGRTKLSDFRRELQNYRRRMAQ